MFYCVGFIFKLISHNWKLAWKKKWKKRKKKRKKKLNEQERNARRDLEKEQKGKCRHIQHYSLQKREENKRVLLTLWLDPGISLQKISSLQSLIITDLLWVFTHSRLLNTTVNKRSQFFFFFNSKVKSAWCWKVGVMCM